MADTPVAPTPVSAWPTAPQRTDPPATFVTRADAWVAATPIRTGEMNDLADNVNFNAESAFDSAAEAFTSAAEAAVSEGNADEAAAASAASANFLGDWAALTGALAPPASVSHEGAIWILLVSVPDVTATEPGVTGDWAALDQFVIEERTSNTILTAADFGKVIRYTAGTFSQTVLAAATLGNGYYFQAANDGSGVITFDPDGAELVNGAATLAIPPGYRAVISCTGTAWRALLMAAPVGDHEVVVTTGNGHGSTNTKARRFSVVQRNAGTAITYADSGTLGGSFTISESALYAINYTDLLSSAPCQIGISVNSAELTTNIQAITAASRLAIGITASANSYETTTVTRRFSAGDVIRAHTDGTPDSGSAVTSVFRIVKVGL